MPDIFNPGTLEMSTEPLSGGVVAQVWSDCLPNRIAVLVALALLVIELLDILMLVPHLVRCLPRWKGNIELEHSVSLARTRNTVALVCVVVFCLVADRYRLLDPSWKALLPYEWGLAVTAGLVSALFLLRYLIYLATPFRSKTSEFSATLRHSIFNYFILMTLIAVLLALLLSACRVRDVAIRDVLYAEVAMFYALSIIRTGQILASRYGEFITILYLCALEILPLGILILTCTR